MSTLHITLHALLTGFRHQLRLGVGDMGKKLYHNLFFFISRFMILSRFFVVLVLLFCKLSEQYSQTNSLIIKPFNVTKKGGKKRTADIHNNNNLLHLYSTFLGTQSALHRRGGGSPHPPPVCSIHLDDVTAAIVCQNTPHTPAYWWRGDRVMKPISVWR